MASVTGVGLALGAFAFRSAIAGEQGGFVAYGVGLVLAAAAAVVGFALLRRGRTLGARAFPTLLFGVFLGRVALVGLFALALYVLAPAHVAAGLLSLVGFHFIFAMIEIILLARSDPAGRHPDEQAQGPA